MGITPHITICQQLNIGFLRYFVQVARLVTAAFSKSREADRETSVALGVGAWKSREQVTQLFWQKPIVPVANLLYEGDQKAKLEPSFHP